MRWANKLGVNYGHIAQSAERDAVMKIYSYIKVIGSIPIVSVL